MVPGREYYPKPLKSVLFVHPDNLEAGKRFGLRHGFKVCTFAHYLSGFIGDDKYKRDWIKNCTLIWEQNIHTIRKTAGKYPQKVPSWWYGQSNWSGYFYNAS